MNLSDLRRGLDAEPTPEPLDPDLLVRHSQLRERGARRSRALLVAVTGVVVVALGVAGAVRAGWFGSQAYIAGMPTPTVSTDVTPTPTPSASPTPTASVTSATPSGSPSTIPATGTVPATPIPAVGTAPAVRTLPDNTWVEVVAGTWFATWQTNWVLVDGAMPTETPQQACAAGSGSFGCRGTIHNTNIVPGFNGIQATDNGTLAVSSSVFKAVPASATATLPTGASYWGVLWRIKGVSGWTLAVWTTPSIPLPSPTPGVGQGYPYTSPTFRIFDAAGTVTGQYPS